MLAPKTTISVDRPIDRRDTNIMKIGVEPTEKDIATAAKDNLPLMTLPALPAIEDK